MREQLKVLRQMQQIDNQIQELEKKREAAASKHDDLVGHLDSEKQRLLASREKLASMEKDKRLRETDLTVEQDKLKKWTARLNDIKNQREYAALNREIEGAKRANAKSEEDVHAMGNEIKRIAEQATAIESASGGLDAQTAAETKSLSEEIDHIDDELDKLEDSRDVVAKEVPADLLRRYKAIQSRRLGLAVVEARDGHCAGCNMNIPPQQYNIILRRETIETCPSCHRILYYEPAGAESQGAAAQ